ncbi:hypothetical protein HID58_046278 [Brassica napus]|uniref:Uncharacterized protein n=1 Tax=Brassica napus TaxID=3708 RepID=A0ABQ8AXE9_BRANA|nr:hypothetical protein HID58_046278 [Brassica napus]
MSCGSGLSGETISENGHRWIGLDISASMLSKRYLVTWGSDYNADQNDLCDDKTMLKMQREQRKRADKENRERRGRSSRRAEGPKQFFERCESIGIGSVISGRRVVEP